MLKFIRTQNCPVALSSLNISILDFLALVEVELSSLGAILVLLIDESEVLFVLLNDWVLGLVFDFHAEHGCELSLHHEVHKIVFLVLFSVVRPV